MLFSNSIQIDSKTATGTTSAIEELTVQYGEKFYQIFRSITKENGNEFHIFSAFETIVMEILLILTQCENDP